MVFGVASFVKLCHIKSAKDFALNGYELTFISTAGVVRGSIVFAMIQYIHVPPDPRGDTHVSYGCKSASHRLLSETVHSVVSSVVNSTISMVSEAASSSSVHESSSSGHGSKLSEEQMAEIDKYCDDVLRIEVLRVLPASIYASRQLCS